MFVQATLAVAPLGWAEAAVAIELDQAFCRLSHFDPAAKIVAAAGAQSIPLRLDQIVAIVAFQQHVMAGVSLDDVCQRKN